MKYSVSGADKITGDERTIIISATDEKDAEQQARSMGLMASTVIERGEFSGSTEKAPPTQKQLTPAWKPQSIPTAGPRLISYNQGVIIIVLMLIAIGAPFFGEFKKPPTWQYRSIPLTT
jgi:hypothetical protein